MSENDDKFLSILAEDLDEEWKVKAACRGLGPSLFFLDTKTGGTYDRGKEICSTCPVTQDCADYREATGSVGLWAGEVTSNRTVPVPMDMIKSRVHPKPRKPPRRILPYETFVWQD